MSTPTDITRTDLADRGTSLIRTYVPIGVGAVLTWLAANWFGVDPETQTGLITAITALGSALWYGVLRWAEPHLPPWARALVFWSTRMPTYRTDPPPIIKPRNMIDPDTGQHVQVYVVTNVD